MKKRKYIALTLILSLLCIGKTYAACTDEEIKEFKQIKNEYKITTEFDKNTKTYKMIIERANSKKYDYVFTIDYPYNCTDIDETTTECTGLKPGTTFEAKIVGNTNSCNEVLQKNTIKLQNYNKYYGDPACNGIEEFVLCQEMYDKDINYETFISRINTYKKTKNNQKDNQIENNENKKINKLNNYIETNLIQIIIIVTFIILVIISTIVMINLSKKSRRLE